MIKNQRTKLTAISFKPSASGLLQLVCTAGCCFASASHAAVIINEVDYDQPGADTAEFIELFNNGSEQVSLDGYHLELVNGSNSSVYRSIDISGFHLAAGAYFVVCNDASLVQNCQFDFTNSSGWIQNGSPDAIALFDSQQLIDALSYEGDLSGYTEGNSITVADSNSIQLSLSRLPNGTDSNLNSLDFGSGCLTPGTANIAGTGDCSSSSVSAVPAPATAWLFGSGLIGLAGVCRKRQRHCR